MSEDEQAQVIAESTDIVGLAPGESDRPANASVEDGPLVASDETEAISLKLKKKTLNRLLSHRADGVRVNNTGDEVLRALAPRFVKDVLLQIPGLDDSGGPFSVEPWATFLADAEKVEKPDRVHEFYHLDADAFSAADRLVKDQATKDLLQMNRSDGRNSLTNVHVIVLRLVEAINTALGNASRSERVRVHFTIHDSAKSEWRSDKTPLQTFTLNILPNGQPLNQLGTTTVYGRSFINQFWMKTNDENQKNTGVVWRKQIQIAPIKEYLVWAIISDYMNYVFPKPENRRNINQMRADIVSLKLLYKDDLFASVNADVQTAIAAAASDLRKAIDQDDIPNNSMRGQLEHYYQLLSGFSGITVHPEKRVHEVVTVGENGLESKTLNPVNIVHSLTWMPN